MYTQFLQIKPSLTGQGVFTKISIPAHKPILEFTGDIIPRSKLDLDPSQFIQIGTDKFIGPSGAVDDYVNHSCNPNCFVHMVANRAFLYSLYVIPVGAELTFDYSTSSTDTLETWKMVCKCGFNKCRKIISGYQYLSEELKQEYIKKDMIPLFILKPNLFKREW